MFENRFHAGALLANELKKYVDGKNIVIGITRGGVVLCLVIAKKLSLPFDFLVIKKIPSPQSSELAIGAVGPSNTLFWEYWDTQSLLPSYQTEVVQKIKELQQEAEKKFRKVKKKIPLSGKTVFLIDDGVATGATVICARIYLRKQKVKKIILGVPVIAKSTYKRIKPLFNEIVALKNEEDMQVVGRYYKDFSQVSDEDILNILKGKL